MCSEAIWRVKRVRSVASALGNICSRNLYCTFEQVAAFSPPFSLTFPHFPTGFVVAVLVQYVLLLQLHLAKSLRVRAGLNVCVFASLTTFN